VFGEALRGRVAEVFLIQYVRRNVIPHNMLWIYSTIHGIIFEAACQALCHGGLLEAEREAGGEVFLWRSDPYKLEECVP
jgi:hypothetical protein